MKYNRITTFNALAKRIFIRTEFMVYSGLVTLVISAVSLISPYLYKILVDDVMAAGKIDLLYTVISAMIIVYAVKVVLSALDTYICKKLTHQTNLEVKEQLMTKFLYRDISNINDADIGTQSGNLEEDSLVVYTFLSSHVVGYITSMIITIAYLLIMMKINFWLGIISIVLVPVTILFSKVIGEKLNKISKKRFAVTSKTRTYIFDTVQKWREVKANTLEGKFAVEYDHRLEAERGLNCKWILYYALRDSAYLFKDEFFMKVLIYFIGGLFIISGSMSIGGLLMFMSYMESMSISLEKIMRSNSDFIEQKGVMERLFKILDEIPQVYKHTCPKTPNIVLKNVEFIYETTEKTILSGVDFDFVYGKKYLLLGKSGEGKSTLIKLLLGINKVTHGEIMINDIPLKLIDSTDHFKSVGAVMQENYFFNLSIRENLQLIAPSASEEEIIEALKRASLDEFIEALPQKLDTVIGERGIKLSGGQKQRLAIARLILHNPHIVILDEATSALDTVTEKKILDNLNKQFVGKTFIVISHKPLVNYHNDYIIKIQNQNICFGKT